MAYTPLLKYSMIVSFVAYEPQVCDDVRRTATVTAAVQQLQCNRSWVGRAQLCVDLVLTGPNPRLEATNATPPAPHVVKRLLTFVVLRPALRVSGRLCMRVCKIYNVLRRLESPTPSEVRRTCKRYLTAGHTKRPAHQVRDASSVTPCRICTVRYGLLVWFMPHPRRMLQPCQCACLLRCLWT